MLLARSRHGSVRPLERACTIPVSRRSPGTCLHCAEHEDRFGALDASSGAGDVESAGDQMAARIFHHSGRERPVLLQCLVVAQVGVLVLLSCIAVYRPGDPGPFRSGRVGRWHGPCAATSADVPRTHEGPGAPPGTSVDQATVPPALRISCWSTLTVVT